MKQKIIYHPSVTQRLIWLDQLIAGNPGRYNIGGYALIEGPLSVKQLEEAIREVLRSQEIYAAVFADDGNDLTWYADDAAAAFSLEVIDFADATNPAVAAQQWMETDFAVPFRIIHNENYLFSIKVLRAGPEQHYCYAKLHHIIADGWSFKLLLQQIAEAYNQLIAGNSPGLPDCRYTEYIADDTTYHASEQAAEDKQFWLQEHSRSTTELCRRIRNNTGKKEAGAATLTVSAASKQILEKVAAEHKASVFQLMLSLFLVFFLRTRQENNIAVALPVLNRPRKIYKQTAGVFMNLICPVFLVEGEQTMAMLLGEVKKKMSQCLRHQRYQYGQLLKELPSYRQGQPAYQLRISYEDFDFNTTLGKAAAYATALSNHHETEPLSIYIRDYHDQGFDIRFVYSPDYFDEETIGGMTTTISRWIDDLPLLMNTMLKQVPLLTAAEEEHILSFSAGPAAVWPHQHFNDMWQKSVTSFPDNIAVSSAGQSLTYSELHRRASLVAGSLQQCPDFSRQEVIALLLPRSADLLAGMIGCLLAGVTYLPIDASEPVERITLLLESACCRKIIVSRHLWEEAAVVKGEALFYEEMISGETVTSYLPTVIYPNDIAYIICTSGSTGQPKAVGIPHRAFINYVSHFRQFFMLRSHDVVLQHASVGFDISVEEIFPVLGAGGRVHILEERRDIHRINSTIAEEGITIVSSTPLIIRLLNEQPVHGSLRLLISGGDVLEPAYVSSFLAAGIPVYNTYGPTESTVCVSYYRINPGDDHLPIGTPISNTSIYILDREDQLLPVGVEGEIHIGGAGLAAGYLNNEQATAEKFIVHPFLPEQRLYRSGDTGRYDAAGLLWYTGRNDLQLKIRGVRIEPGEVEYAMLQYEGIMAAVVLAAQDPAHGEYMAAFVVIRGTTDVTAMRVFLRSRLPEYMIPLRIVAVDSILLNTQGKPDITALRLLLCQTLPGTSRGQLIPPETRHEKILAAIWEQILPTVTFGVNDNFFELGGHSLSAVTLAGEIENRFGISISIVEIFRAPTIRQLAEMISGRETNKFEFIELD
ncbi:amino acid adenylation domain-containing protein [Chitinophaga sp. G-6-1-13]|uniref:Amino acid adenylation domain-containing protein n=1 Tax=Chitinophaga fulva TaxID=2728842 RepID=A0A848GQT9_9BACT|nr:non-ribosomal peptide synthetase [Chitinophaga fulva]NML39133.1 amino acid adenylation domain-containing protein [Chitinophaga fulva]